MAAKSKAQAIEDAGVQAVAKAMARPVKASFFQLWLVGDTPLIAHAWSEKAKREMLGKQVKAVGDKKQARDPDQEFTDSLYRIPSIDGKDVYGFTAMAFKRAIVESAHKDKGIARTAVQEALWVEAPFVRVKTAHPSAICDLPLVRLYGGEPEMREDMVRIGSGQQKTSSLAYRAQFTHWAVLLSGRVNTTIVPLEALSVLIRDAGLSRGVGDWRNEKNGVFGSFHLASADEQQAWEDFVAGKGPLPTPTVEMKEAA